MGNRARIITENHDLGVYLHWNGGYDSVSAFLKYCELKGYAAPDKDGYGWARLCQVIGNFFGGTNSVGIYPCCDEFLSTEDNGVYVIRGWEIVDRITSHYFHGEQKVYPLDDMLKDIDASQPVEERFGERFFDAKETPREELKVGDRVLIYDCFHSKVEEHEIVKRSSHAEYDHSDWMHPVKYYPLMIMKYPGNEHYDPERHFGNRLTEKTYRVIR